MMTMRVRVAALGLGIVLLGASGLAGCASSDAAGAGSGDVPKEDVVADQTATELTGAWLDGGNMIAVITQGSTSCAPTAGDVQLSDGTLEVEFVDPPEGTACTKDLGSRVTLVQVPEGVDPTAGVTVVVDTVGTLVLPGAADAASAEATDHLPSAAWTGSEGEAVLLTWGSSTCVPSVASASMTDAGEVAVTFADPADDQVCTMDLVAQGTVIHVDGETTGSATTMILTGDSFEGVSVPVTAAPPLS